MAKRPESDPESHQAKEPGSITRLIRPLREGHPDAQRQLVDRFFEDLARQLQHAPAIAPNPVGDAEDAANEAFHSFLDRIQRGHFPDLHNRDDLRALLWTIATCKLKNQGRAAQTQKRGGGRVIAFGDLAPSALPAQEPAVGQPEPPNTELLDRILAIHDLLADHDDPAIPNRFDLLVVELALDHGFEAIGQRIDSALDSLDDELRTLFDLRVQGLTRPQIARHLGSSESGVKRRSRKLRAHFIVPFQLELGKNNLGEDS